MTVRMIWRGDEAKDRAYKALRQALFQAGWYVRTEANKTVPHETGALHDSGGVDIDDEDLVVSVFYDTPYARVQHERLDYKHKPGRRAKWLEKTLQEEHAAVRRFLMNQLKKALKE